MRLFILALGFALGCGLGLAGCGCGDGGTFPDFGTEDMSIEDMSQLPMCPAGVDAIGAKRVACTAKDTLCVFAESPQVSITCHCECGKVWECDSVLAFCDGGA